MGAQLSLAERLDNHKASILRIVRVVLEMAFSSVHCHNVSQKGLRHFLLLTEDSWSVSNYYFRTRECSA